MTIDSFTTLFLILTFLIPGFITNYVYRKFIPIRYEEKEISFLNFIALSCVNFGVWSWLIFWMYQSNYYSQHILRTGCIWFLLIFLSPVLLGIIWGLVSNSQLFERILGRVGIKIINPIPLSWDYKFSNITEPIWVLITLKDDSIVAGYWGNNSFASSDSGNRDIYIQKVYKTSSGTEWQPTPDNNDGILVKGDYIKTIEFFRN